MTEGIIALCGTAALIGFGHTLLGPDHYLPFVAMSRVGRWSFTKTMVVTVLCGFGHVISSVVLGLLGIAFGIAVLKLEHIEALRGDVAGWLLLAFGSAYFVWGIRRAIRNRPHTHVHVHADGSEHAHEHIHAAEHVHVHGAAEMTAGAGASMTPWVLFTIFLFGPCEPLIPMLMYPAAKGNVAGVILVALVFGVITIATMTTIVALAYWGVGALRVARLQRYSHALAGFVILACGVAIKAGF